MKPIIFFDGGCPLCRREIQHYQQLDHSHRLDWIDITKHSFHLDQQKLSFKEAMEIIHGTDQSGRLISGAAVFVLLWSHLPYYRHLASVVTHLKLLPSLDWCYRRFARWRFQQRLKTGCPLP